MRGVFIGTALISVVALATIFIFLLIRGVPGIREIGFFNFIFGREWHEGRGYFGIGAMIATSMVVMLFSTAIGATVGILMAVFMFKYCPKKLVGIARQFVNLLAGIPSVIFGLFGLLVLIPLFTRPGGFTAFGILPASLVLSIMVMPTVVAISLNALIAVPREIYEGALALGASKERAVFRTVLPAAKSGVMAAVVLAVARAIGETMAVIMVIGGSVRMPSEAGLLSSIETMTAAIARTVSYASGSHRDALIGIGLVLFFFSLLLNSIFMYFKRKGNKKAGITYKTLTWREKWDSHGKAFWIVLGVLTVGLGIVLYVFSDQILFPFRWLGAKIGWLLSKAIQGFFWALAAIKITMLYHKLRDWIDKVWSMRGQIKFKTILIRVLIYLGGAIVASALVGIIAFVLIRGVPHLSWHLLFGESSAREPTLAPAFVGTLSIIGLAILIATPVGLGTAIFLSEYAGKAAWVDYIRMAIETLAGIPSIVYGLFGFLFFVIALGMGQTLMTGAITVSIMILPVMIRTVEESLLAVPKIYREGSMALGASKVRTTFRVVLPNAMGGVITALILAIGRIIAESAALLLTIGMVVTGMPSGVTGPGTTLTLNVYFFGGTSPDLAAASAVVLLIFILILNLTATGLGKLFSRGKV